METIKTLTAKDLIQAKAKFFFDENAKYLINKLSSANAITDEIKDIIATIATKFMKCFSVEEIEFFEDSSNREEFARMFGDCCYSCMEEAISHTLTGSVNSHFSRERWREYSHGLYRFVQQLEFLFKTNLASMVPASEPSDESKVKQASDAVKNAVDKAIL